MALTDFLSGIADAIRAKDGTTDVIPAPDFRQRILDISSGTGQSNISFGSFIPTQNTNTVTIEHGLAVVPNFAIVYIFDDISGVTVSELNALALDTLISNGNKHCEIRNEWGNYRAVTASENTFVFDDTNVEFNVTDSKFWSGKKYVWICGRIMENG